MIEGSASVFVFLSHLYKNDHEQFLKYENNNYFTSEGVLTCKQPYSKRTSYIWLFSVPSHNSKI